VKKGAPWPGAREEKESFEWETLTFNIGATGRVL